MFVNHLLRFLQAYTDWIFLFQVIFLDYLSDGNTSWNGRSANLHVLSLSLSCRFNKRPIVFLAWSGGHKQKFSNLTQWIYRFNGHIFSYFVSGMVSMVIISLIAQNFHWKSVIYSQHLLTLISYSDWAWVGQGHFLPCERFVLELTPVLDEHTSSEILTLGALQQGRMMIAAGTLEPKCVVSWLYCILTFSMLHVTAELSR